MTIRERLFLAVLLLDSLLLALFELLFLPLRLDGACLLDSFGAPPPDTPPNCAVALPDLGAFPLPVAAVIAAVTMPVLVSLAARLSANLAVGAAPLLVWLLCIGVFGLAGPGGDRVLIEDWRALLLLAAGALPAAVMLGGRRG